MKLQDILNSDKKIAIHCKTEEEAKTVFNHIRLASRKKSWEMPHNSVDYAISQYGNNLCYAYTEGHEFEFSPVDYYADEGYTIIHASEFIAANTEEQPKQYVKCISNCYDLEGVTKGKEYELTKVYTIEDVYGEIYEVVQDDGVKYGWHSSYFTDPYTKDKPVLFTTHDGVDVREGDEYWYVHKEELGYGPMLIVAIKEERRDCYIRFSTEQAAKDWIEQQKAEKSKEETLIPFDYEKAKANKELVRNSGGHKPDHIFFYEKNIACVYDDGSASYYGLNGYSKHSGYNDLMLVDDTPEVVTYMVSAEDGVLWGTKSKEAAIEDCNNRECNSVIAITTRNGKLVKAQTVYIYKK